MLTLWSEIAIWQLFTAIPEHFEMAPRIPEELAANDAATAIRSRNCRMSLLRYPFNKWDEHSLQRPEHALTFRQS
jgi:hypothetical protein